MAAVIAAARHNHQNSALNLSKTGPDQARRNSQYDVEQTVPPKALQPIERFILNWHARRCPGRLHRRYLAERLNFEYRVMIGTARLINQLMVFALLVGALR